MDANTNRMLKIVIPAIVIIAVIYIAVSLSRGPSVLPAVPGGAILSFQMTDPPQVPVGANALLISYSSIEAHVAGNGTGTGWFAVNGNGTVNLMALVNQSQIIGNTSVQAGDEVNLVRFNVTSARIEINGTYYNVTVPSGAITAHVQNSAAVNGNQSVLLDMAPVIATIYTSNSTIFVLVPSLRAVVVSNASTASHAKIGASFNLNASARAELEAYKPNISISNASVAVSGNSTSIKVTVKNSGNSSVAINHLFLYGNESVSVSNAAQHTIMIKGGDHGNVEIEGIGINGTGNLTLGINSNADPHGVANGSIGADVGINTSIRSGSHASQNNSENESASGSGNASSQARTSDSGMADVNVSENESENMLVNVGVDMVHFGSFTFIVGSNGNMTLPSSSGEVEGNVGLVIPANSSATLTFSGDMTFGNSRLVAVLSKGSLYRMTVSGENAVRVTTNVTAS
jgi:uncharacterized protein YcfL